MARTSESGWNTVATARDIVARVSGINGVPPRILPHNFTSTSNETNCWVCGRMDVDACHESEPKPRLNLEMPVPGEANPHLWFLPHPYKEGDRVGLCWCDQQANFPLHDRGMRRNVDLREVARVVARHGDGEEVSRLINTWVATLRGELTRAAVAYKFVESASADSAVEPGVGEPGRVWSEPHPFEPKEGLYVCGLCSADRHHPLHRSVEPTELLSERMRKKLAELAELQLRWAAEAKQAGLVVPGSLMEETYRQVVEMNRVVNETEAAETAYGHGEIRCAVIAVGAKPEPGSTEARIQDLTHWWAEKSLGQVDMVAAKAVEYGSNSLTELGRKLAQLNGREVNDEEAQELGCWINAVQKMGRWTDAVRKGARPSDDSIVDLMVYCMMSLRLRETGGWPDTLGL